jgi:hypothetical protein
MVLQAKTGLLLATTDMMEEDMLLALLTDFSAEFLAILSYALNTLVHLLVPVNASRVMPELIIQLQRILRLCTPGRALVC